MASYDTQKDASRAGGTAHPSDAADGPRRIIDAVDDHAIVCIDPEGRIATWNAGAARLFGFEADDAIGRNVEILYTAEDRAAGVPQQELRRARAAGRARDERWHARKTGEAFYASGSISASFGPDGRVRGYAKICRDLTETVRLQQSLREADRRRDEFLAKLGHELRNPLAPIRMATEVLARSQSLAPDAREMLAVIQRQALVLGRLVDDLVDTARSTRAQLEFRRETVDVVGVVEQAVASARPELERRRHRLEVSMPGTPVWVDGDAERLAQAIGHVLNNAGRYTEPGGRVEVWLDELPGHVAIHVRDDGAGFPEGLRRELFEPLVPDAADQANGDAKLGVGLAFVKTVVEMHGGRVDAQPGVDGRGSDLALYVPIATPRTVASPEDTPAKVGGRRVLVVDDNEDAAESLSLMLQLEHHDVHTAYTGASALESFHELQPSTVILDIGLPGMDGYEVARRMRALPGGRHAQLIAVTGYGQPEDRTRSSSAGFDAHLVKPVDPADILRLLGQA